RPDRDRQEHEVPAGEGPVGARRSLPAVRRLSPGESPPPPPKNPLMPKLLEPIRKTQIWRSVFRHGYPDTPRNRTLAVLSNVFLHLHPVKVRRSGIRLSYTWCMGGLTFFLFLVETITGLLLMFYYRPTPEAAYQDIIGIREHVALGVMREMHRWAAHMIVITVCLHMYLG